ncbi:hypothetical protein E2C01_073180 [Portunus trituberculatus]|uniref:Uncharacterized protein n=1 Tax=Portunus trituberculatus TaxID=210409 RepID=A0A5B7I9X1_PORTR|nr:hypothetical protein [Portunus trituberculatus]
MLQLTPLNVLHQQVAVRKVGARRGTASLKVLHQQVVARKAEVRRGTVSLKILKQQVVARKADARRGTASHSCQLSHDITTHEHSGAMFPGTVHLADAITAWGIQVVGKGCSVTWRGEVISQLRRAVSRWSSVVKCS